MTFDEAMIVRGLASISKQERVNLATFELACVLYENAYDGPTITLDEMIELVRKYHGNLMHCYKQSRLEAEQLSRLGTSKPTLVK